MTVPACILPHPTPRAKGLPRPPTPGSSTWAHQFYRPETSFMGQYSTLLLISPTVLSRVQGRDEPFTHLKKIFADTCNVLGARDTAVGRTEQAAALLGHTSFTSEDPAAASGLPIGGTSGTPAEEDENPSLRPRPVRLVLRRSSPVGEPSKASSSRMMSSQGPRATAVLPPGIPSPAQCLA